MCDDHQAPALKELTALADGHGSSACSSAAETPAECTTRTSIHHDPRWLLHFRNNNIVMADPSIAREEDYPLANEAACPPPMVRVSCRFVNGVMEHNESG